MASARVSRDPPERVRAKATDVFPLRHGNRHRLGRQEAGARPGIELLIYASIMRFVYTSVKIVLGRAGAGLQIQPAERGRRAASQIHTTGSIANANRRSRRAPGEVPRAQRDELGCWPVLGLQEAPRERVEKLKARRLAEARRRGVPAFRILTDRALLALAAERPASEEGLLRGCGKGKSHPSALTKDNEHSTEPASAGFRV